MKYLIWLMVAFCVAGSPLAAESSRPTLEIIPQPQQFEIKGAGFRPGATAAIRVTDDSADRFAAHLLVEALRGSHGIDAPIITQPQSTNLHSLWLGDGNALNVLTTSLTLFAKGHCRLCAHYQA